jgi:predicted HTH transcriptional regulator
MIEKPIDEITKADIESLIADAVREGRAIDYKRDWPGDTPDDRKELLADFSSFANASGGELLFGVEEKDGIPIKAEGLSGSIDEGILRIENIVRDGIQPRIPGIKIRPVEGFSKGPVLVVKIPKSWNSPHMVDFRNASRFFTRNSAGKYQMDVTEIRSAFLMSEEIPERMRR